MHKHTEEGTHKYRAHVHRQPGQIHTDAQTQARGGVDRPTDAASWKQHGLGLLLPPWAPWVPRVKVGLAGAQGWLSPLHTRGLGQRAAAIAHSSAASALLSPSVSITSSSRKPSLSVLGGELAPRGAPAQIPPRSFPWAPSPM